MQDFNYLMDLMNQMDLEFSRNRILDYLPNSTNCMTWPEVKASHETDSPIVIIRIDNIYGMMILLAVGLGGSLIVFILELFMRALKEQQGRWNLVKGNYIFVQFYYRETYTSCPHSYCFTWEH